MSKHKNDIKKVEQDDKPISRWVTIAIIVFILLALLSLLLTGGNNQTWYPGKPFNQR